VTLATQGEAEAWQLSTTEWPYRLHPAPVLLGLLQIVGSGLAPHYAFSFKKALRPKALQIYALNIAPAGSGKSTTTQIVEDILKKTPLRLALLTSSVFSDTGIWTGAFERCPVQLMVNDEAESLLGKGKVIDNHLSRFHTLCKQLYDQGQCGVQFRPSIQVQRQIEYVTAPHLNLFLAATMNLLTHDVSDSMKNDGFLSRFVVSIDSRPAVVETEEEACARELRSALAGDDHRTGESKSKAAKFITDLWRDAGIEMVQDPDVDIDQQLAALKNRFESTEMDSATLISYRQDDLPEVISIWRTAEAHWKVPQGEAVGEIEANISSLRTRTRNKINVLSTLLTLIADPKARYIDMALMRWVADFLYKVEYPFYKFLCNTETTTIRLSNKWQVGEDSLEKLRPALQKGGPLFDGGVCKSAELREFSRSWRRIIGALRYADSEEARKARSLLIDLGVGVRQGAQKNQMEFYLTGD
jgi:hypothetical protein